MYPSNSLDSFEKERFNMLSKDEYFKASLPILIYIWSANKVKIVIIVFLSVNSFKMLQID